MPAIQEPAHAPIAIHGLPVAKFRDYEGKASGFKPAVPAVVKKIGDRYEVVRRVSN